MIVIFSKCTFVARVLLTAWVFLGHSGLAQERMPITTRSVEARKEYEQGAAYLLSTRLEIARPHFEKALQLDTQFPLAVVGLAQSQPRFKDMFDLANQAVGLLDKIDVSEGERLYVLGFHASLNNDRKTWQSNCEKIAMLYPNDEGAQYRLANYYFGQGDYEKALERYEKTVNLSADFAAGHNMLGYTLKRLGRFDEAENAFRKYAKLASDDPNAWDSLGEFFLKMGRFEESISAYEEALKLDKLFDRSHIGIASNLILLERHEQARERLNSIFKIAPNDGIRSGLHFAMAVTYADEGKYSEAVAEIEKNYALSEKINDTFAMATDLGNLRRILIEAGRYDEALQKSKQALEIISGSDHPQRRKELQQAAHTLDRATVALKKGNLSQAQEFAQQAQRQSDALKNRNLTRGVHQIFGMIALEKKEFQEAVRNLLASNTGDAYNLYRLAVAYEGLRDTDKSREMLTMISNYNSMLNLNYSFVRHRAAEKLKILN